MGVVTGIKVQRSADRSHDHIVGVWTQEGSYRTNRQLVKSIQSGERWYSTAGAEQVPISWIPWCTAMNCGEGPYLVSRGAMQVGIRTGIRKLIKARYPDSLEMLPSDGPRPIGYDPAAVDPARQEQPA
ncbi:MAG: hypothetical protein LC749_08765 [Actinobacteria bacterium]|nr:hypothetical protein [Actinomycetota bacterium]